jgi:tetratricopeptide (TPR) repeat protein
MSEEVSKEKAKEIIEMLTGGGSIDSINTSLALGILPLVESIGDLDLLERLVEHAQNVAEDDIEKGWARFEHLKRNSGSIDDIAELAFHSESLEKGEPLAAAVLHHHALMLLSIDDVDSAQTSVRRSLTIRESIDDKEGIIYGLAVLSRCSRLNQDWDSAIIHDTRRLELAIAQQNDILHMEALADVAHAQASLGELGTASELYQESLDLAKRLEHPAGHLVASWGVADLAEIETRYDDALLALSDTMHLFMQLGIPAPDLLKKRLHALTSLGEEVK